MTGEAASWAEWGVVVDRQVWPCATPHIAAGPLLTGRRVVRRTVRAFPVPATVHYLTGEWAYVPDAEVDQYRPDPDAPPPCGTRAAYRRHEYRHEVADQACCDAEAAYRRELHQRHAGGVAS